MKYLFCLLIPAGLFLLIISIKYVIRFAKAEMIYEMPYSRGTGTFTLAARGKYGLWLSGEKFKKAPLGEFGLTLVNRDTGQSVPLCAPLLRTAVTGLSKSRLKLYSFQAEAGTYTVSLNDEVRIRDKACAFLVNAVTKRPVDYSLFSVQVYRHTSGMVLSLCILGIIFGAVIMVSGAILPAVLEKDQGILCVENIGVCNIKGGADEIFKTDSHFIPAVQYRFIRRLWSYKRRSRKDHPVFG